MYSHMSALHFTDFKAHSIHNNGRRNGERLVWKTGNSNLAVGDCNTNTITTTKTMYVCMYRKQWWQQLLHILHIFIYTLLAVVFVGYGILLLLHIIHIWYTICVVLAFIVLSKYCNAHWMLHDGAAPFGDVHADECAWSSDRTLRWQHFNW